MAAKRFSAFVLAWLAGATASVVVNAETGVSSVVEKFRVPGRTTWAVHVGAAVGDPLPATFGLQAGLSFLDVLRVQLGVGREDRAEAPGTVLGLGVRARLPEQRLSPVVGASWIVTGPLPHLFLSAGLEWRPWSRLEVGAGYARSFDVRIGGQPYLTASWNLSL